MTVLLIAKHIIGSGVFFSFVDKTKFIFFTYKIFSKKEQSKMKKQLKPTKPVHKPWLEVNDDDNSSMWELNCNDSYSVPEGGPKFRPSNAMQNAVSTSNNSLVPLPPSFPPLSIDSYYCREIYAYMAWVQPKECLDCDGNKTKST